MLPIFLRALELLKDVSSEFTVVIHVAPNKDVEEYIRDIVCEWPVPVILLPGGSPSMKYNAFSVSAHRLRLITKGPVFFMSRTYLTKHECNFICLVSASFPSKFASSSWSVIGCCWHCLRNSFHFL